MRAIIEVLDGGAQGLKTELLEAPTVVGRSPDCRLRLDPARDVHVSGQHCQIEVRGDRYWVVDLNSSNGTFVNQRRISEQPLSDGDVLTFGLGGPSARFSHAAPPAPVEYREAPTPAMKTSHGSAGRIVDPAHAKGAGSAPPIKLTITNRGQFEERTFTRPLVRLGRHPSNDVSFDVTRDVVVSSNHAKLSYLEGVWTLVDLESTNGVWLRDPSGQPRRITRQPLIGGEEFELGVGGPVVRFELLAVAPAAKEPETIHFQPHRILEMAERDQVCIAQVPLGNAVITIGRDRASTVRIPEPHVSAQHARLAPTPEGWLLEDLGSKNGTFLGGQRVARRGSSSARSRRRRGGCRGTRSAGRAAS